MALHDQPTTTRVLAERAIAQDLLEPTVMEPDPPVAPDGYQLQRCLGEGGSGVVWLARDTRLDRPVAVKFLRDARVADLERFRREARFTARLRNPSIVQVYELGEAEELPYIAMEYIDGGNLADADLDPNEVVRVLRDVAIALRHTHAEGIVHRDIKPANILLDAEGRPYLTDFGIARSLEGGVADTISSEGQVMGTPGLMPPEQARGEVQAVDARSDIYALGATLFMKLTGRFPFEATNVVDILHAVIHQPPPLLRSRRPDLPRCLETIAARCMQKAREDRYQCVDEIVEAFDRFLDGGEAAEPDRGSAPWLRRLVANVQGVEEPVPVEDLEADTSLSMAMEMLREITTWDADLYRVSGSLERSFSRLDAIQRRLEAILEARPDTAWARFYRGVVFFRRGCLLQALEEMERSIDRVSNLAGAYYELGRLYIALHLREAHLARKHLSITGVRHDMAFARDRLEQGIVALQEAQRLGGDLPPWLHECIGAVAKLSESDYAGCVEVCDRILADEPDVEAVWKLRGDAQHLAGDDPIESYERAVEVRRSYFEAWLAAADAHTARFRFEEARDALANALRIHPGYTDAAAMMARTYLQQTRRDDADVLNDGRRYAAKALELDPRHYDAAVTLAEIEIEAGRRTGDDARLLAAVEVLDRADGFEGCGNRVALLSATARLERARRARADGRDPRPELDRVMELCTKGGELVEDNEPWVTIRREAEVELAKL